MDELSTWINAALKIDALPDPAFQQSVGWSTGYDQLLDQEFDSETPLSTLAQIALDRGRVVLTARGGSGKTVALKRLALEVAQHGRVVPVFLSLFLWNSEHQAAWEKLPKRSGARIDFLLNAFAPSGFLTFASASPRPRLLIVDSLNEVRQTVGAEILEELSDLVAYRGGWRVIVADRLIRRSFPPALPWALATLLPISLAERQRVAAQKKRALEGDNRLLGTAYFLNLYLNEERAGASAAALLKGWFEKHTGLERTSTSLSALAMAALKLYEARSRTFRLADLVAGAGKEATDALVSAGAIVVDGENAHFDHQLKHDFLVGIALIDLMERDALQERALDVATFDASSFDVLALALELAETPEVADRFVRATYDWNLYGTAYAVAEAKAGGASNVSREMEIVLMAMLAEKRWDLFQATSVKATDALRRFPQEDRKPFLEAATVEAIVELVRAHHSTTDWYDDWASLFCQTASASPIDSVALVNRVDIFGWTAANVLRRLNLPRNEQDRLRAELRRNRSSNVHWRIVHVLGAFPSKDNVDALFAALDADAKWVQYGAVRSLVELAARHRGLRPMILSRLTDRAEMLRKRHVPLRELHDALFVDARVASSLPWEPAEWKDAITPLVETLHDTDATAAGREFWQRTAYDLRRTYG